jgi:tRNA threonylcarbamoyladenosine biosynthesis protein TsaE
MEYITTSAQQTQQIAKDLATQFRNQGGIIALIGDLGAGKTTFTQGFAEGLGITDKIISPTFVLMRQHQLPNSECWLFHLDLYRLEGNISISQLGLDEIFSEEKNIILIEWAEKVLDQLPQKTIKINFQKISETERKISVGSPT